MKKVLFVLFSIFVINAFCPVILRSAKADEAKTFVGVVKSFAYGFGFKSGPPLWPLGMIEVVADDGQKNNFLFIGSGRPGATVFYDTDGKDLGAVTEGLTRLEAGKKAGMGKKVEVTYTTPAETARFIHRNLAISVRYVPIDYVVQASVPVAASAEQGLTIQPKQESKVIAGTIETVHRMSLHIPPGTPITILTDKGERIDIFLTRDLKISELKGYPIKSGKKVEINYFVNEKGENEATSFRYVP